MAEGFDEYLNNTMTEMFGKRRGGLYRSERDWYVFADNNHKKVLNDGKKYADIMRQGLYDEKGFSRKRGHRWMGGVPYEVVISNPELLYDAEAVRRFFKEFPAFSTKGK